MHNFRQWSSATAEESNKGESVFRDNGPASRKRQLERELRAEGYEFDSISTSDGKLLEVWRHGVNAEFWLCRRLITKRPYLSRTRFAPFNYPIPPGQFAEIFDLVVAELSPNIYN